MRKRLQFMLFFLYLFITHIAIEQLTVYAAKGQTRVQRVSSQEQENKVQLPDLNHSPPPEEDIFTPSKHKPKLEQENKTSYAKKLERLANKGLLNKFRESQNIRVKAYRKTLKPEVRLAQTRKNTKLMTEKYNASEEAREHRRKIVTAAKRRSRARRKAKKLGIPEDPKDALRQ